MPQCMEKYKNDFAIRFATVMQKRLPFWKSAQNQERWELVSLSSLGIYLVSFLLGFVPGRSEHEYNLNFHIFCSICTLIIGIISVIHSTNKNYQDKIKQTLFPDLLKVFGDEIYYGKYSILGISEMIKHGKECKPSDLRILNGDFLSSDLFKSKKITQREDDDCFWGRYNDIDFAINETDFGYTTGNNKYARMFKGVAMHFKMNKKIKSRVLILSKKIGQYVPPNYEKVNVEYNKFNKNVSKTSSWLCPNAILLHPSRMAIEFIAPLRKLAHNEQGFFSFLISKILMYVCELGPIFNKEPSNLLHKLVYSLSGSITYCSIPKQSTP